MYVVFGSNVMAKSSSVFQKKITDKLDKAYLSSTQNTYNAL